LVVRENPGETVGLQAGKTGTGIVVQRVFPKGRGVIRAEKTGVGALKRMAPDNDLQPEWYRPMKVVTGQSAGQYDRSSITRR